MGRKARRFEVVSGPLYSVDTHALYWHETQNEQLSPNAKSVFDATESGRAVLILHPIVLAEFYFILRKFGHESRFPSFLDFVRRHPSYRLEPIDWADFALLDHYQAIPEMHDRLIAIQAVRLGAVLVTRDSAIQAARGVSWIW